MLLAELEVYHSRPIAPTRRVALGRCLLPCDPAPGPGGLLLGAVVARFVDGVSPKLFGDLVSLIHELETGRRIPQPRLRHRFQHDRVGLTRSTHRLYRDDADGAYRASFADDKGSPAQHVLGALYAAQRLLPGRHSRVLEAISRGLMWTGEIGPAFFAHLGDGDAAWAARPAGDDPVDWAMAVLGLSTGEGSPERSLIQRSFRSAVIDAHPDHGGDNAAAARRIAELTEARRILLAS